MTATGRVKVLYIAGSARCGSTLLDRVLGEATGFVSAGELNLLWRRGLLAGEPCSCHTGVRECPFWQDVFGTAFGGFDRVDASLMASRGVTAVRHRHVARLALTALGPVEPPHGVPSGEVLGRLYSAIGRVSAGRVIVDSSKHASYALLLAGLPQLDIYVVHLVRDSRAVAHSLLKRKVRFDTGTSRAYMGVPGRTAAGCAVTWLRANALADLLQRRVPYLRLRYEDFVRRPINALCQIGELVGEPLLDLPLSDGGAGATVELSGNHAASGNPMRFQTGRVEIVPDEAWREALAPAQRGVVTALTWPYLRHFGYAAA